MTTLNQIAENIAFKLNDQFNATLKESIKDTLINYRAKLLRDDLDRNFISLGHFGQTVIVPFEVVSLLDAFQVNLDCISAICGDVELQSKYQVLKSKNKLPLPLRRKNVRSFYSYLGRADGSKNFTYVELDAFPYIKTLPYNSRTIYYTFVDGYLYIINNLDSCDINNTLSLCKVRIRDIFENPRDLYNPCIDGTRFVDDSIFPVSRDMLVNMSNAIVKGEYPLVPKDGQQINIKPDDND